MNPIALEPEYIALIFDRKRIYTPDKTFFVFIKILRIKYAFHPNIKVTKSNVLKITIPSS